MLNPISADCMCSPDGIGLSADMKLGTGESHRGLFFFHLQHCQIDSSSWNECITEGVKERKGFLRERKKWIKKKEKLREFEECSRIPFNGSEWKLSIKA